MREKCDRYCTENTDAGHGQVCWDRGVMMRSMQTLAHFVESDYKSPALLRLKSGCVPNVPVDGLSK